MNPGRILELKNASKYDKKLTITLLTMKNLIFIYTFPYEMNTNNFSEARNTRSPLLNPGAARGKRSQFHKYGGHHCDGIITNSQITFEHTNTRRCHTLNIASKRRAFKWSSIKCPNYGESFRYPVSAWITSGSPITNRVYANVSV